MLDNGSIETSIETVARPAGDTAKHARRLSDDDKARIAKLAHEGESAVSIAQRVGCARQTADYWIKELAPSTDLASIYIRAKAFKNIQRWDKAADIAATKGNHVPAKELAEAAMPELRPAVGNGNGTQVVVMLGTSGQPLSPPALTLSPVRIDTTERNTEEIGLLPSGSHKVASVNGQVVDSNE